MFLDFLDTKEGRKLTKAAREAATYNAFYAYWRNVLFERVMRIFIWEDTEEVQPKEIEQRLILSGHCGITKIKNEKELTAVYGSFSGISKYQDEKPKYNYHCPIDSGQRTIGKDIIIISNNSLRNPTYELVHHYAMILAHNEVTIIDALINARDAGGVPIATNELQKQSIADYQAKRFNGVYGYMTDMGAMGLAFAGAASGTGQSIDELWNVRMNLLKSFQSDIGIKSSFEKRSNTVVEEVEADTSELMLNISDMLHQREKAAKEVNDLFGKKWKVRVANEINYINEGIEAKEAQLNNVENS